MIPLSVAALIHFTKAFFPSSHIKESKHRDLKVQDFSHV